MNAGNSKQVQVSETNGSGEPKALHGQVSQRHRHGQGRMTDLVKKDLRMKPWFMGKRQFLAEAGKGYKRFQRSRLLLDLAESGTEVVFVSRESVHCGTGFQSSR